MFSAHLKRREESLYIYMLCTLCVFGLDETCLIQRQAKDEDVSALDNEREKQRTELIEKQTGQLGWPVRSA